MVPRNWAMCDGETRCISQTAREVNSAQRRAMPRSTGESAPWQRCGSGSTLAASKRKRATFAASLSGRRLVPTRERL